MGTLHLWLLGAVATIGFADPAPAAWITIKNDTSKTIVIQETRTVNGKLTKGKSYRLTPGEVLKEFQTGAGEKTVLVSEADGAVPPVKARLTWGQDGAVFLVTKREAEVKLAAAKTK